VDVGNVGDRQHRHEERVAELDPGELLTDIGANPDFRMPPDVHFGAEPR
jgi:hypothetical protein